MSGGRRVGALTLAVGLAGPWGASLAAQPLLERTPNLAGTWVPAPTTAHFTFLHRFELVGDETTKLVNYPTLVVAAGLPASFALSATYTSNSELGAGTFHEWELGVRRRFGTDRRSAAAYLAWNTAAESVDGEIAGSARLGRLTLLAAVRGFTNTLAEDESGAAGSVGALVLLKPRLSLTADVARLFTNDSLPAAWSAGFHVNLPGTPHTLGLVVSNTGVTTLQGASRGVERRDGDGDLRYGFAFTMPLGTLDQWARIFHGADEPAGGEEVETGVEVVIRDFAFGPVELRVAPGTTVTWVNRDPTEHSVTSAGGEFDSGLIPAGGAWSRRFDRAGRYLYHCTPHPFMRGVVVVESG